MTHAIDDHEDIRRGNEQERVDFAVTKRGGQGGKEVLETAGTGDTHVSDGKHVGFRIDHGELEAAPLTDAAGLVDICFGRLDGQSSVRDVLHFGRQ